MQKQEDLLESSTDALEWKMEVERVMPSLKVHLRSDKVRPKYDCKKKYFFKQNM